jgi:hypothetical protein
LDEPESELEEALLSFLEPSSDLSPDLFFFFLLLLLPFPPPSLDLPLPLPLLLPLPFDLGLLPERGWPAVTALASRLVGVEKRKEKMDETLLE